MRKSYIKYDPKTTNIEKSEVDGLKKRISSYSRIDFKDIDIMLTDGDIMLVLIFMCMEKNLTNEHICIIDPSVSLAILNYDKTKGVQNKTNFNRSINLIKDSYNDILSSQCNLQ